MTRPLVIYHGPGCPDGFTAAWVAWLYFRGEADFHPAQYGQEPPDVAGRDVYVLDFSYKRSAMLGMAGRAAKVVVLDHHKAARRELEGLSGGNLLVVFDMQKAGCRLAWEHFFPGRPVPWIVSYVEDRDIWKFYLLHSREVSAAISSYPFDFQTWQNLVTLGHDALIPDGAAILRYKDQEVIRICLNAREVVVGGHRVLAANTCLHFSEVADRLAEGRPFGACWFIRPDGKRQWSLRSREGGIDVSEIARQYGGGGHECAAGFEEDPDGDVARLERLCLSLADRYAGQSEALSQMAEKLRVKSDPVQAV